MGIFWEIIASYINFIAAFKISFHRDLPNSPTELMGGARTDLFGSVKKHIVKCEEKKLCKTYDLNVKVKTVESKFWLINDSKV